MEEIQFEIQHSSECVVGWLVDSSVRSSWLGSICASTHLDWLPVCSTPPIFLVMKGDEEEPALPHQTPSRQNQPISDQNGTNPTKLNQTHDKTIQNQIIDILSIRLQIMRKKRQDKLILEIEIIITGDWNSSDKFASWHLL